MKVKSGSAVQSPVVERYNGLSSKEVLMQPVGIDLEVPFEYESAFCGTPSHNTAAHPHSLFYQSFTRVLEWSAPATVVNALRIESTIGIRVTREEKK